MAIFPSSAISSASGYEIDQSLRFNDNDTAYLSKTFSSGDEQKWTLSAWIKRGSDLGTSSHIFGTPRDGGEHVSIFFNPANKFCMEFAGGTEGYRHTTAVYRDTSAWYHFMVATDTTLGDRASRCKLYVNGEQITDFGLDSGPDQNLDTRFNRAIEHNVGRNPFTTGVFDGYMAEVHWIDGTQLTPSSFGETDSTYGHWKPKKVSGLTYGTNGFYLDFSDSAALGDDAAGSNDFTVNNLTASDQMLDTPTNNFAVINGITGQDIALSEGNLKVVNGSGDYRGISTIAMQTGKWYCEMHCGGNASGGAGMEIAKTLSDASSHDNLMTYRQGYQSNGTVNNNLSLTQSGSASSFTTGDIISCTFDLDSSPAVISWYKNDSFQFSLTGTALNGEEWVFMLGSSSSVAHIANFGQDSSFAGNKTAQGNQDGNGIGDFYYTPPTDFLALCTSNLPDPAVIPSEHFNTVLWTGNGSTQSITGVGFEPNFSWIKSRSITDSHHLFDSVRGAGYRLRSDSTAAENYSGTHYLTAFNSDGFALGGDDGVNKNTATYAAWNWKANGSGSSNTDGSITSTVSANQDAGFSIVSYEGTGVDLDTIGHGLSKAPEMYIVKNRDQTDSWKVGAAPHIDRGYSLHLDGTNAENSEDSWGNKTPTSTVLKLGQDVATNTSGEKYIGYMFHSVDGYSKVGSYIGNDNEDGTFVYTGFRPQFIMVKDASAVTGWYIYDTKRDINVHNPAYKVLVPNTTGEESGSATSSWDILSNGFKLRHDNNEWNDNGDTMIYIAFAETPFKYANAR